MLYIVGLGFGIRHLSVQSIKALRRTKRIYFEYYTTPLPSMYYSLKKLFGKKVLKADRSLIEEGVERILEEARIEDVAIAVVGDPLFATTHYSIVREARS